VGDYLEAVLKLIFALKAHQESSQRCNLWKATHDSRIENALRFIFSHLRRGKNCQINQTLHVWLLSKCRSAA
jgi:hypothetical protein